MIGTSLELVGILARLFEGSGLEYRIGVSRGGQCWVQADDPHQCNENDLLKNHDNRLCKTFSFCSTF